MNELIKGNVEVLWVSIEILQDMSRGQGESQARGVAGKESRGQGESRARRVVVKGSRGQEELRVK